MSSIEGYDSQQSEEEYYDEICGYLQVTINGTLASLGDYGIRLGRCGTRDMSWGLQQIFESLNITEDKIGIDISLTRDLFVDIVGFAYNTKDLTRNSFVICEVKLNSLTLNDFAQLLGYCVASNTEHGLLISVNHSISSRLDNVLRRNRELIQVRRPKINHKIGIMTWKPQYREMLYHQLGFYRSVSILARALVRTLNKVV